MKWTTNKPTEPGWYWVDDGDSWQPECVKVHTTQFGIQISEIDRELPNSIDNYSNNTKWSGPIPEPEDE